MSKKKFKNGTWIVHLKHGAGIVEGVRELRLSGTPQDYYLLKTERTDVWLPVTDETHENTRTLISIDEIEEAKKVLVQAPEPLPDNNRQREIALSDVQSGAPATNIAAMIRDLWSHKITTNGLTGVEREAWLRLFNAMCTEWSAVLGQPKTEVDTLVMEILESTRPTENA